MFYDNMMTDDEFAELKKRMRITDEEIDCLKQLCEIQSKQTISTMTDADLLVPSSIIDDFLYHGNYMQASDVNLLEKFQIRNIISACDFPLEKDMSKKYNVIWIDIDDVHDTNIRKYFDETNEFLHACRNKNERVLVHCLMGISRSSSIVLAYLLKYYGHTVLEAYDYLVARRPIAQPNYGFLIQLIRYEKDLKKHKTNDTKVNPIK